CATIPRTVRAFIATNSGFAKPFFLAPFSTLLTTARGRAFRPPLYPIGAIQPQRFRTQMSTMQRDGEYRAWFRTSRGAGTGVVYLVDGKISGGDCFFDYSGSYQVEDGRFTATLTTRRRADG